MNKLTFLIFALFLYSCSDSGTNSKKYNPPADHTVDLNGAMHLPQYDDPDNNCFKCHGLDLEGTEQAPSCFACHDKNW